MCKDGSSGDNSLQTEPWVKIQSLLVLEMAAPDALSGLHTVSGHVFSGPKQRGRHCRNLVGKMGMGRKLLPGGFCKGWTPPMCKSMKMNSRCIMIGGGGGWNAEAVA